MIFIKTIRGFLRLKRSSIYKFMDEGHFPKSVSIGGRSVMWKDCDIDEWICEKIRRRN
ncbi:AlpA family phage regulatory protein [Vibrio cholerae]|nr:AlpA family phage regulatory protein [Vibrio cholerae]